MTTNLLIAMIKIIVSLVLGFVFFKARIITSGANAAISKLLINLATPCLIFATITGMDSQYRADVVTLLWIGVIIYVLLTAVAFVTVKLMRVPAESFYNYLCMIVMGNVGFLGFPLAESLFGSLGLFYMGILNIHFNIFAYTFGAYAIAKNSEIKQKFSVKTLINAGTVSVILALAIFMLGIQIPDIIYQPISFIGEINSPAAMIVLGAMIAGYDFKTLFNNWRYYVIVAVKMIILPLITFFVLRMTIGAGLMTSILTIYVGCPIATTVSMFTMNYKGDWKTVSSCTGLTTIMSFITIPMLYVLLTNV